jgi:hypothetical protein
MRKRQRPKTGISKLYLKIETTMSQTPLILIFFFDYPREFEIKFKKYFGVDSRKKSRKSGASVPLKCLHCLHRHSTHLAALPIVLHS